MSGGRPAPGRIRVLLLIGAGVLATLLLGTAIVNVAANLRRRKPKNWYLRAKLQGISLASSLYFKDFGQHPPSKNGTELARLLASEIKRGDPPRIHGPYVDFGKETPEKAALDPWGTPLLYERSDDGLRFTLGSAGPDRKFGTDDDTVIRDDGLFLKKGKCEKPDPRSFD